MRKIAVFFKIMPCVFFVRTDAFCVLLENDQLDKKNYVEVHIWNDKIKDRVRGESVGHAALRIVENQKDDFYVSLYPGLGTPQEIMTGSVPPDWHSLERDGLAQTIVRLYSLNRTDIRWHFDKEKPQYTYTLPGNGKDSPFRGEWYAANCAVLVRNLLNHGSMEDLFRDTKSAFRYVHAAPATVWVVTGVGLGMAGALVGGAIGTIRGAVTLQNPVKTATEDGRTGGVVASSVFTNWSSRNLSKINYGHPVGASEIVTPYDLLRFAKEGRRREKQLFPKTEQWLDWKILLENGAYSAVPPVVTEAGTAAAGVIASQPAIVPAATEGDAAAPGRKKAPALEAPKPAIVPTRPGTAPAAADGGGAAAVKAEAKRKAEQEANDRELALALQRIEEEEAQVNRAAEKKHLPTPAKSAPHQRPGTAAAAVDDGGAAAVLTPTDLMIARCPANATIFDAIESIRDMAAFKILLSTRRWDIQRESPVSFEAPLMAAVKHQNVEAVKTLLEARANPNTFSSRAFIKFGNDGNQLKITPLLQAVNLRGQNALKFGDLLLQAKADPNLTDSTSPFPPIALAIFYSELPLVKLLVEGGASVKSTTRLMGPSWRYYREVHGYSSLGGLIAYGDARKHIRTWLRTKGLPN